MKCLLKYPWVKLPRDRVPGGKGLMGSWMRLAARAAFRKGEGHYCGYENPVEPGMWVGGIVGLKSIMGIRRKDLLLGDNVVESFDSRYWKNPFIPFSDIIAIYCCSKTEA